MTNVKRKNKQGVLTGIVIPAQWDTNGRVITISIHTNDEKIFIVEHTKTGNDLFDFIHKEVKVTGKIRERIDGKTSISIKSFMISNSNDMVKKY